MNIKIEPLTLSNFNEHSLDDFRRRQQVTEVWRRNGNEMELVYQPFVEDWDADVRREAAERMLGNLRRGYFGTSAFDGGKLVGWTFYGNELIGERKNYVELHMFHVSELYRGKGIGRRVFEASLPLVRETGAERIFILTLQRRARRLIRRWAAFLRGSCSGKPPKWSRSIFSLNLT